MFRQIVICNFNENDNGRNICENSFAALERCLELDYHLYGTGYGTLVVYIENHISTMRVLYKRGNFGNTWQKARVRLPYMENMKVIIIIIIIMENIAQIIIFIIHL